MIQRSTIVSSKLFSGSADRTKILSALANPLNSELLQQSAEDIKEPVKEIVPEETNDNGASESKLAKGKKGNVTKKSGKGGVKSITSEPKPVTFKKRSDESSDTDDSSDDIPETSDKVNVEELLFESNEKEKEENSERVITNSIEASSNIEYVSVNAGVIKDTLNNYADTKGVVSVAVKEENSPEMWLYYDDETNLNDTIYAVVSLFNSSGYNMIKFNRLARSNNAIVFDILNVNEPIKSVVEVADEA